VEAPATSGVIDAQVEALSNLLYGALDLGLVKSLPHISKLYRCLVNSLQQGGSKLSVNSLLCLSELILNDKLGDKVTRDPLLRPRFNQRNTQLFNRENTSQTLNLIFSILMGKKPDNTKQKSILLLRSVTRKPLVALLVHE
jgi:hypothetical protein